MLEEVLHWLDLRPGQTVVDLTVGLAGHGQEIIRRIGPQGMYIGLEWDPETLALARQVLQKAPNAHLFSENMVNLPAVMAALGLQHVDGVLLDAGPNLWQLTAPHRSLAHDSEAGLDMRMSPATQTVTAAQVVAEATEGELRRILRVTLTESEARRIAKAIVRAREREPIRTTRRLAEIILAATHPAARYTGRMPMPALLAFRIHVNAEIDNLREGIRAAASVLRPGEGRLVVLTFHSAEFRACRQVMKELARGCICPPRMVQCACGRKPSLRLLTPRPLAPDADSLRRSGPQCRSCRLHAAQAA